jgi:TetR/AcrR family transcriptional regulator
MPPAAVKLYRGALDTYRRRLIVDAARQVFERVGLEGASIRAIAQAAGCTTGAIYPHFAAKEEIYAVVLGESLAAMSRDVSHAMAGAAVAARALRRGTVAIYKYYDARPSELTLALFLFNGSRVNKLGKGLDQGLERQLEELLALLGEQVRKITKKPFQPMVRIEAMALFTYLVGLLVLKHSGRIDVVGNNASVLLAHYTRSMVARLSGRI